MKNVKNLPNRQTAVSHSNMTFFENEKNVCLFGQMLKNPYRFNCDISKALSELLWTKLPRIISWKDTQTQTLPIPDNVTVNEFLLWENQDFQSKLVYGKMC